MNNKSNDLKEGLKGGLDSLFSATSSNKGEVANPSESAQEQKKEKAVHCNLVIERSIHTRMKYLALDRNMSLKDVVNDAMLEYLEKYEGKCSRR